MPGTLTLGGLAAGLAGGQNTFGPTTMTGVSTIGQTYDLGLSTGDNTFTLPSGETFSAVVIWLGTTTATVKFRTNLNSSDAGTSISPYVGAGVPFVVLPLPAGVTSVILNASGSVSGGEMRFI